MQGTGDLGFYLGSRGSYLEVWHSSIDILIGNGAGQVGRAGIDWVMEQLRASVMLVPGPPRGRELTGAARCGVGNRGGSGTDRFSAGAARGIC